MRATSERHSGRPSGYVIALVVACVAPAAAAQTVTASAVAHTQMIARAGTAVDFRPAGTDLTAGLQLQANQQVSSPIAESAQASTDVALTQNANVTTLTVDDQVDSGITLAASSGQHEVRLELNAPSPVVGQLRVIYLRNVPVGVTATAAVSPWIYGEILLPGTALTTTVPGIAPVQYLPELLGYQEHVQFALLDGLFTGGPIVSATSNAIRHTYGLR